MPRRKRKENSPQSNGQSSESLTTPVRAYLAFLTLAFLPTLSRI